MLIILGIILSFQEKSYSLLVMIAGFLLLNIHTASTIRIRQSTFIDYFKWITVVLFIIVAVLFIINFQYAFWLLIIAICFQIITALIRLRK